VIPVAKAAERIAEAGERAARELAGPSEARERTADWRERRAKDRHGAADRRASWDKGASGGVMEGDCLAKEREREVLAVYLRAKAGDKEKLDSERRAKDVMKKVFHTNRRAIATVEPLCGGGIVALQLRGTVGNATCSPTLV
jgi:hypothetical protein